MRLSAALSQLPLQASSEKAVNIMFGSWTPDLPDLDNMGSLLARNVYPLMNGFGPAKALVDVSTNALDDAPKGAIAARDDGNNIFVYAGDTSKLYELRDNAFSDQSKAGGYTTQVEDSWEFAIWDRSQRVLATNFTDPIQWIGIGQGNVSDFADLITSTNKPKARHIGIVRDFTVLGNTNDTTDGLRPNRLWWSAIGDETDFDPDAATQCDFSDLPRGGWVQRIIGGAEYGVVFQESLIRRMEYIGSPQVFDIPAVDRQRGTPIPNSVVEFGRNIFYISEEGFFVFNGSSSEPIGNNRVDRTFWSIFDLANKAQVSAAVDVERKLVCWAFPAGSSTQASRIFCFKWDAPPGNQWSEIEIDLSALVSLQNQGFTLDGLDAVNSNLDLLTPSLDSDVWKGGKKYTGGFGRNNKLQSFDGDKLQASLETTETELMPGRQTLVTSVRPIVQYSDQPLKADQGGLNITCTVSGRDRNDIPINTFGPTALSSEGEADIENENRYQRFGVVIAAAEDWDAIQGVTVYKSDSGRY